MDTATSCNVEPLIVVVGSSNMDLFTYAPTLPKRGETLFGTKFATGFGGKGANQAVMASKLGGQVSFIGKLGTDMFGQQMKENFESFGMDTKNIIITDETSSGVASIAVAEDGGNTIVVVGGANNILSPEEVKSAEEAFKGAKVFLTVLEVPVPAVLEGLKLAKKHGLVTILNPAPAKKDLPEEFFQYADIVCPNETELEILTNVSEK